MKTTIAAVAFLMAILAQSASAAWWPRYASSQPASKASQNDTTARGDWEYEVRTGSFLWVSTRSDRASLGQYCNVGSAACAWILVLRGAECTEGEQHPVLVNTERAASHHLLQCMGEVPDAGAAFAFTDFDRIDFAVRHARQLGIAIPEQDDDIGVMRFTLAGAEAAIDEMREELKSELAPTSGHRKPATPATPAVPATPPSDAGATTPATPAVPLSSRKDIDKKMGAKTY
jgi:hypothetical protein